MDKETRKHQIYLEMATILAETSECEPKEGVLFVKDKRIIVSSSSEGEGINSTSHAIQVALHKAAAMGAGVADSICYTTEPPCKYCLVALQRAGVTDLRLDIYSKGENSI